PLPPCMLRWKNGCMSCLAFPPQLRWSTVSPWGTREDVLAPTSANPSPRCVPTTPGVRHLRGAKSDHMRLVHMMCLYRIAPVSLLPRDHIAPERLDLLGFQ